MMRYTRQAEDLLRPFRRRRARRGEGSLGASLSCGLSVEPKCLRRREIRHHVPETGQTFSGLTGTFRRAEAPARMLRFRRSVVSNSIGSLA